MRLFKYRFCCGFMLYLVELSSLKIMIEVMILIMILFIYKKINYVHNKHPLLISCYIMCPALFDMLTHFNPHSSSLCWLGCPSY